jgi:hypothetical protein
MLVFILGLIFLLGMFYVKRRLDAYERRLELLTETIQTMAGIRMDEIEKGSEEQEEEQEEEEQEEEEEDEEEEEEEEEDIPDLSGGPRRLEPVEIELPRREWEVVTIDPTVPNLKSLELEDLPDVEPDSLEPEIKLVQLPKTTVSDDDVTEYSGLTLKELKEKIAKLDGPKLKSKKECIDFLKIKSNNEV